MASFSENVTIAANMTVTGDIGPPRPRTELATETAEYPIDLTNLRVWDAYGTILNTAASDDLGITAGTWATNTPKITAGDLSGAGATTRRARFQVSMPPEYQAGQSVKLRLSAGMTTTVSDGTATVDLEAFKSDEDGTIGGSDLVTTSATSINSLTFADYDFVLTATNLAPGDILDVRLSVAVSDTVATTAVIADVGAIKLVCTIRG